MRASRPPPLLISKSGHAAEKHEGVPESWSVIQGHGALGGRAEVPRRTFEVNEGLLQIDGTRETTSPQGAVNMPLFANASRSPCSARNLL